MQKTIRNNFAATLKRARIAAHLSKSEMAESLGMTPQNYGRIELANQPIPSDLLPIAATLVNCSIDELYSLAPPTSILSEKQMLMLEYIERMPSDVADAVDILVRLIYAKEMSAEMVTLLCSFARMSGKG